MLRSALIAGGVLLPVEEAEGGAEEWSFPKLLSAILVITDVE
jgi:hypothetical protein